MSLRQIIHGVLFPESCIVCGTRGSYICADCGLQLPPAAQPQIPKTRAVYAYQDSRVKRLIQLFKYRRAASVVHFFAGSMARVVAEDIGEDRFFIGKQIVLVPIPLSRKRLHARGFNQSEMLARAMIDLLPSGTARVEPALLQKIKETTPQARIRARTERVRNMQDCFVATRTAQGVETIVLIDDVTTTGATLLAARSALRAKGFTKIQALAAAH